MLGAEVKLEGKQLGKASQGEVRAFEWLEMLLRVRCSKLSVTLT